MQTLFPPVAPIDSGAPQKRRLLPTSPGKRGQAKPTRPSWMMAWPGLFLLVAIVYVPTIAGSYYAFTEWDGFTEATWIGTENFQAIFSDPVSRDALWNTISITIAFTIAVNIIGVGLALGLNRTLKSRNWLRAVFFAPMVVSSVAVGYLWQYILQADGPLNRTLKAVGLESWAHPWLGDPSTALWSILVVMLWQTAGLAMVIYLAGLSGIPDEVYEAAAVDGAGRWRQFRSITVPALSAAITINVALAFLQGFRLFDQVVSLTNGGPANSTQTLQTEIYNQAFGLGKYGYSAAIALLLSVLLVVMVLVVLLVSKLLKRRA